MPETPQMNWYGIRTIYLFKKKQDVKNTFEERICVFCGSTEAEAYAKAQAEAEKYAQFLGTEWYPVQMGYLQDGDPLIDGYEVWSEVFEFDGTLEEFVEARYGKFEYHPDR